MKQRRGGMQRLGRRNDNPLSAKFAMKNPFRENDLGLS